ncbi:MAG TPA: CDP-alcohol phosphatidyltransferase family protein [Fimbriiglobus sp.]|nr:CDP-alcohol phosphatidyltransferase family protein [Fimbriiglobus sp.]
MPDPAPLWTVPNLLSLSRLPLAVVLCACIAAEAWPAALAVFAAAALTDWLDGWWARRFNQGSALGRSLDPLTDKVLVGAAFIYLIPVAGAGIAPWMVAVVVCRELLVTGLRGVVEAAGKQFGADWFGKLKTALQCAVLVGVFVILSLHDRPWAADSLPALEGVYRVLLYAMLAATVGSMAQYVVKAARLLR